LLLMYSFKLCKLKSCSGMVLINRGNNYLLGTFIFNELVKCTCDTHVSKNNN
jgi:hypothetical protein